MKLQLFSCILGLAFFTGCEKGQETAQQTTQEKVFEIPASHIETSLVLDKTSIMLGEPIHMSFIVENLSDQDLQVIVGGDYSNEYGRPNSFSVKTLGGDGLIDASLPEEVSFSGGGFIGPKKIPSKERYTFSLFLPNWAKIESPGNYTITATRILRFLKMGEEWTPLENNTTSITVGTSAELKVEPFNNKKFGVLITHLGNTMLGNNEDAYLARQKMGSIDDARVIPYFLRAYDTGKYSMKYAALHAFAKFNDEKAFEGLKRGLEVNGETDSGIINAAIHGIAKSPHPDAIPYLLSRRYSEVREVRLTVVHALGKMNAKDAIPILEEMKNDKAEIVRGETRRYLKRFDSKQNGVGANKKGLEGRHASPNQP